MSLVYILYIYVIWIFTYIKHVYGAICVCVYNDIICSTFHYRKPKRTIVLHYYQFVGETFLLIFYSALYTYSAQWYMAK